MRSSILVAALALPLLTSCKKTERTVTSPNPANWSVSSVAGLLKPGTTDTVRFAAVLDSGWYIYSLTQVAGGPVPMSVTVDPSPPFTIVGEVAGPKPVNVFDKEFNINTERYVGKPTFAAVVAVAHKPMPPSLNVRVRYQACNETLCLPARTTTLTTPVRVADRQ
jgi:thiol:disulfide interchange protein DsbD